MGINIYFPGSVKTSFFNVEATLFFFFELVSSWSSSSSMLTFHPVDAQASAELIVFLRSERFLRGERGWSSEQLLEDSYEESESSW